MLRRISLVLASLGLLSSCVSDTGQSGVSGCTRGTAEGVFQPGAVTIAAAGDMLMNTAVQRDAAQNPGGYAAQLSLLAPIIRRADISVVNLETPTASGLLSGGRPARSPVAGLFDGRVYSGYPSFNAHPSLVTALKDTGFDILQTANNHALDRGPQGADKTLAAIRASGLAVTGTRPTDAPVTAPWHAEVTAKGHRIAFLACTYGTNGIPDRRGQVLGCYSQRAQVLGTVSALAQRPDISAVILLPHWGAENVEQPNANQRSLARAAFEAGAAAIVGAHPHVLQPIEVLRSGDRTGFVAYSLGNLISSQWRLNQRTGAVALFDLVPDGAGRLRADTARYVPTRLTPYSNGFRVTAADQSPGGGASVAHAQRILGPGAVSSASLSCQ